MYVRGERCLRYSIYQLRQMIIPYQDPWFQYYYSVLAQDAIENDMIDGRPSYPMGGNPPLPEASMHGTLPWIMPEPVERTLRKIDEWRRRKDQEEAVGDMMLNTTQIDSTSSHSSGSISPSRFQKTKASSSRKVSHVRKAINETVHEYREEEKSLYEITSTEYSDDTHVLQCDPEIKESKLILKNISKKINIAYSIEWRRVASAYREALQLDIPCTSSHDSLKKYFQHLKELKIMYDSWGEWYHIIWYDEALRREFFNSPHLPFDDFDSSELLYIKNWKPGHPINARARTSSLVQQSKLKYTPPSKRIRQV
ncbi:uncharacterized protein MELLADRAFT_66467 [Melampsora larici-populina 98AG31]|uniref:Uncharacterized protein n=1 Tax=Melampsora larici-populina (strain 98AG31 / pathotype 3-4-7) TaxID=747676 RepID=F4RZB1_MELLP|nr:uncharacterized protein MELLADRAFT_66467 [Melampsora larici-populina 98AG31]EGG02283.1 hypothetical protein MELLADRAFT_66467 [Melampsora larici-populina 98AG31]